MKLPFIRRVMPRNRFLLKVSVLAGGTVGAQAILVIAAPILTRLYAPQDFGLLAVFVSLLSLVTVVASLRYEQAIPLPEDDKDAAALLLLSLFTTVAVASTVAVFFYIWRHPLAGLLNTPQLAGYLILVPLGAMLAAIYNVLKHWAIRMKAFGPIAKTKLSQSIVMAGIQLAGAPLGPSALVVGQIAGQGSGSLSLFIRVLRDRLPLLAGIRVSDVLAVARRYKQCPVFSTWGALFNTAGAQLPSVMFAVFFSPAAAGMYALANRVLSMPMQLLGQSIGQVFFSDAAQAHREGRLGALVAGIHGRLAHIGMPPMIVLLIAGPDVFAYAFGNEWRASGVFAQWLAPWLYLVFVTAPLTSIILVLDQQATGMVFQAVLLAVRSMAIAAGAWFGDLTVAVALFAVGSAVCWLINLAWVMRVSGNTAGEIWRSSSGALVWGAVLSLPVFLTTVGANDPAYWLFSLAAALLLIAARYAFLLKNAWI